MKIKNAYQLVNNQINELKLRNFISSTREWLLFSVYPLSKGTFDGFGAALTQSSAYNYSLLKGSQKKQFLEMLVGETGLRYTIFRLCVGSSDFATHEYQYLKDELLESFSIEEDKKVLIPFIKDIIKYSKRSLTFFASPWSPPAFMKTISTRNRGGKLKDEYYEMYANYIVKYIEAYENEGIHISALTIQNEPKATQSWESCVFEAEDEIKLGYVLDKVLKEHNLNVDLYAWDHNKERLFERADKTFKETGDLFKGAAFHWYSGDHFDAISAIKAKYPHKKFFESEFCISHYVDETKTPYDVELVNCLRVGANAIVEWNALLDENGGPYHDRGSDRAGCASPIHINSKTLMLKEGLTYKKTYMFSHFIENNGEILYTSSSIENIKISAVKNPNGDIAINIVNNEIDLPNGGLYIEDQFVEISLPKNSVTTILVQK